MKYRALDGTGDYTLGRRGFLEGRTAVAQAIRTRLLWLSGEWWENVEEGLPLFENILGAYQSPEMLADADLPLSERITTTKGVTELTSFSSDFSNWAYTATATVNTEYGAVEIQIGGGRYKLVQHRGMETELFTSGSLTAVGSFWQVEDTSAHFDTQEGCSRIGGCLALCSAFCLPATDKGLALSQKAIAEGLSMSFTHAEIDQGVPARAADVWTLEHLVMPARERPHQKILHWGTDAPRRGGR